MWVCLEVDVKCRVDIGQRCSLGAARQAVAQRIRSLNWGEQLSIVELSSGSRLVYQLPG